MKKYLISILILLMAIGGTVLANIEVKEPMITQQLLGGVFHIGERSQLTADAQSIDGGTITYQWYCTDVNDISTIRALYSEEDENYGKTKIFEPIQELGTKYYCYMAQNTITRDDESASAFVYSQLVPVTFEKPFVIEVSVEVDSPVVGEIPAKTAKPLKDGYMITGVHWSPDDEVFKEDTEYTVSFDIKIDEGSSLRSDYFGIVNGNQAEMPYEYNEQGFLKYTFPKTETIVEDEPEIVEEKPAETVEESEDIKQPTTSYIGDNKMELLIYVLIGIISFVVLVVIIRAIKSLFNR